MLDIVGRYTVTIGGKRCDTVCVMDIETYDCGVVSEQFLDKNGKTILWRRFNRNDWAIDRYKKKWSEQLPAEKLIDRIAGNADPLGKAVDKRTGENATAGESTISGV